MSNIVTCGQCRQRNRVQATQRARCGHCGAELDSLCVARVTPAHVSKVFAPDGSIRLSSDDVGRDWSRLVATDVSYLLIDCSGSMAGVKLTQAREGTCGYARQAIQNGYRVGVVAFSDEASILVHATNNADVIAGAVSRCSARGGTNMEAAIVLAMSELPGVGSRVMIIVTDGRSDSQQPTLDAATLAKSSGIAIVTIGTDGADEAFLRQLSSGSQHITAPARDLSTAIAGASRFLLPRSGRE